MAKVYLVGAGPGDPGLITVKGMELIKKADCIIYDRLAAPELLGYARRDCELFYVGKADSRHTLPQEKINELLVEKAGEYHCVVRLKGGDVFVFGRGGEEGIYLREHGISFSVVPGVSSAVAGPAYAGIPVTHRGIATSFRVITGHKRDSHEMPDLDFSGMMDPSETLVFLMGLSKVRQIAEGLIAAGRDKETPAAVISHATTEAQSVCSGTLSDIADRVERKGLTSPALIVVGDVVTLRESLRFYEDKPLWGFKYLVAKIGQEPSRLTAMLREKGAQVRECRVGEIMGIPAKYSRTELENVDILIFTSANAVTYFMRNVFASGLDARALSHAKAAVIGQKTQQKLKEYGICADFIPEHANSKAFAKELKGYVEQMFQGNPFKRAKVWYPMAKNAKEQLVDELLEFCDCGRLDVYENVPCPMELPEELTDFDALFFTCASSAERLLKGQEPKVIEKMGEHTKIYSIGPKCSAALSGLGVSPVIEAAVNNYEGLVNCVLQK